MSVTNITDQNFEESVLRSEKPVMVDFFAQWCGPCRMAEPIVEELAKNYKDKITIGKLDVDANQQVATKYGVMSIPTVIIFKDGKELDRKVGFGGREGYEGLIKKAIK